MGHGMAIFSRPITLLLLALTFLLAGYFGGPASALDRALIEYAAEVRAHAPGFTRFAASFTELGGGVVTIGLATFAALVLLLRRRAGAALLLAGAAIGERLLVDPLKDWIGRPRPSVEPLWLMPQSLAYPSGHSANSMAAFMAIALIAIPPTYRRAAAVGAFIVAILVGLSRITLGVHWPTDVIGGWALGLFCVGIALWIGRRSGALPLEPQHDVVGRHLPSAVEDKSA